MRPPTRTATAATTAQPAAATRLARASLGGALVLLAVLAVWPQALGLAGVPLVAQAIALRGPMAVAAVLGAALLVAVRLAARRGTLAALSWVATWVAVWCLAVAAGHLMVLAIRGTAGFGAQVPEPAPADLTVVLAFNTQGQVSAEQIADLVAARGADVVALPETSPQTAERAASLLAAQGYDYQVLAEVLSGGTNPSTAALVAPSVGRYQVTERGPAATFVATGTGPPLTVVHTRAPVDPGLGGWATSTASAVADCPAHDGGIVAGDFNATVDHPAFGGLDGCVDAASIAGRAGVATWPSFTPRWFGAPIDHVLVDPRSWSVVRAAVLDGPGGSDHRPLEVVLVPR